VHNGYIYWAACALDRAKKQLTGNIKRIVLGGDDIETVITDQCYGLPYASNKGIYWLGQYLIFLDDSSDKVTKIIDRTILEGGDIITGTSGYSGDRGVSDVISIDDKNIYFSIAQSMVPGFSSCTDESESVWKYSFADDTLTEIITIAGDVRFYKYNNIVYIVSECNANNSKSFNLENEKILDIHLPRITLLAVDDTRIYWTDQEGSLLVMENNDNK
jgi:hypothetical protein